jgi:hypothetical protein
MTSAALKHCLPHIDTSSIIGAMETVAFINCQGGDDLIVSFAIPVDDDPDDVESLTLLRTPKYEGFLDDAERGVKVMPENDDDEHELLKEFRFDKDLAIVRFTTQNHSYELDVRKVDPDELKDMCAILRKMNSDQRIKLSGV